MLRSRIIVVLMVAAWASRTFAAFDASGIGRFSGAVIDTTTWRPWVPAPWPLDHFSGSITQNDGLIPHAYDTSGFGQGVCEAVTQTLQVQVGQSVRATLTPLAAFVGEDTGLWLTTRGDGPSFTSNSDFLLLLWEARASGQADIFAGYGESGSIDRRRIVQGILNAINRPVTLQIDWLTPGTAHYAAFDGNALLGATDLDFSWMDLSLGNSLYIGLRTTNTDATFSEVTYTPLPEPSVAASLLVLTLLWWGRRGPRRSLSEQHRAGTP
jgi:hypothetical protein